MSVKLRRAQTIQPFGVGALVDFQGESFLVQSIDRWRDEPPKRVAMKRLEQAVGGKLLLSFDEAGGTKRSKDQSLSLYRFPRWYHCSRCGHLRFIDRAYDRLHQKDNTDDQVPAPKCLSAACKGHEMSPMRFVAYCDAGHLSEIDWFSWCHRGGDEAEKGRCASRENLYFRVSGRDGGDFHAMRIECRTQGCGRSQSLSDVSRGVVPPWLLMDRPDGDGVCSGKQPWQYKEAAVVCKEQMKIEPKGSSSIYRGKVLSALDLEDNEGADTSEQEYPELDELFEDISEDFSGQKQLLKAAINQPEDKNRYALKIMRRAKKLGITFDTAISHLLTCIDKSSGAAPDPDEAPGEVDQQRLFDEEMQAFREGTDRSSGSLVIQFFEPEKAASQRLFQRIGQVKSLRELRVLAGFTRGQGTFTQPVSQAENQSNWLPCVEAFGEGIYFELNQDTMREYFDQHLSEVQLFVREQLESLRKLQEHYNLELPDSPLYILSHTLSHLLIRQLTFNSGYSSSALRERVYVDGDDDYAGILIYTTDTDSEGTLGGLVDQGRVDSIEKVVLQVRNASAWCSADPVCREAVGQGFRGLNRSACHCCSLISETSCQHSNAMLNRVLLGGLGQNDEPLGLLNFI